MMNRMKPIATGTMWDSNPKIGLWPRNKNPGIRITTAVSATNNGHRDTILLTSYRSRPYSCCEQNPDSVPVCTSVDRWVTRVVVVRH
jgi:hypothetical protein